MTQNTKNKHLLILGAGASMSLVSKENPAALPSGKKLVAYIADYNKIVICWLIACSEEPSDDTRRESFFNKLSDLSMSDIINISENNPDYQEILKNKRFDNNEISMIINNKDLISKLSEYTIQSLKEYFKNYNYKNYLINLLFVSMLVRNYMPVSIDYFANNLEFFAEEDIDMYKKELEFAGDAKTELQKYLKVIICEYLVRQQSKTLDYAVKSTELNYIRRIIWNLSLEANKLNSPVKKHIEANLDIITFNYDTTAEELLKKYHSLEVKSYNDDNLKFCKPKLENINVLHVYSYLGASNDSAKDTLMNKNLSLLQMMEHHNNDTQIVDEHIDACNKSIFWIRCVSTQNDSKNVYKEFIKNAKNIYFLGFGFDKNNLDNIGILDQDMTVENTLLNKKFFVSKSSSKLISIFKEMIITEKFNYAKHIPPQRFDLLPRYGDHSVFQVNQIIQPGVGSCKLLFSMKDIDKAFSDDFDI